MEEFNKEDVYDSEISLLMRQLINVCNKHNIPMIASFTYEYSDDIGVGRRTTLLNGFENRKDEANKKAAGIIRSGGHGALTFSVTTKQKNTNL